MSKALKNITKLKDTVDVVADFGADPTGVADSYPQFIAAITYAKSVNKALSIADAKLYLGTQSAPINLDGVQIIGNGKLPRVAQDTAYLNGTDHAVAMWNSINTGEGSGIFSRYNGAIFTGKAFNVIGATILGDYNKASSSAFVQTTVTTYPGWSLALLNCQVDCYYFGSDGINLAGGLEVCSPRNINVWLCGGYCLNIIGTSTTVNAPIEYFDFDASSSFIGGKLGNVYLNGFRRHVKFDGCLLNSAGQYDVQLAANGSFTIASQTAIISPIRVTALAAGTYGGVNHSGSNQLEVRRCYAEVAQGIVQIDGASVNSAEVTGNSLIPWNNALPRNLLSIQGALYRLRTSGNNNIDGSFPVYISAGSVSSANDYKMEESTASGGVVFTGSTPLDKAIIPVTYNFQSGVIGDGTAGTFTYSLAFNEQTPNNNAVVVAIYAVTANFQSSAIDRNETVLIAVTQMNSGNYTCQVLVPPATANSFSASPTISTAGLLSIPLTLYTRARITRIDTQPLKIW